MTRTTRFLAIGLAVALLAILTPAASWGKAADPKTSEEVAKAPTRALRVEFWHLWQNSGAELYQELCASCHGAEGGGNGPAARELAVPAPALIYLQRAGIHRQHWTYALNSPCEDSLHRQRGHETMPCWRRIFRQALGNDTAPLLVNKKLVDYLASIQQ